MTFTLSNIFQTKIHPEILNIQLLNSFPVTERGFLKSKEVALNEVVLSLLTKYFCLLAMATRKGWMLRILNAF